MGDRAYELTVWKKDPALARRAGYRPPVGRSRRSWRRDRRLSL